MEVPPEAENQESHNPSEQPARVKLGAGVKALELPYRKRRSSPTVPVSLDPFIDAIEYLLSMFQWLVRIRSWSILPTIIGAIVLEIVVAHYVSSHFSVTTYVPLDTAVAKSGWLSTEEFLWPTNAACIVFVTNILVTWLLAGATMVSCLLCYRKQSRRRAGLLLYLIAIEMLIGMVVNPLQIIVGAVPPPNSVVLGGLALVPIMVHCLCGLVAILIVLPLLRKQRTKRSGKSARSKG